MDSQPDYPLLQSVSYRERPDPALPITPERNSRVKNDDGTPEMDGSSLQSLTKSADPKTPKTINSQKTPWIADSPGMASGGSSQNGAFQYTADHMHIMQSELIRARQNGEIPRTTASPMDTDAMIEDYGYLTQLREARGDVSSAPPQMYQSLLVEITRRIKERDSIATEQESQREAARRINNYLQSVERESSYILKPRSSSLETPSAVDITTLSQELLSIVEKAADQTMVDSAEPLRLQLRRLGVFVKTMSQDRETTQRQQETMRDAIKSLNALFGPHSAIIEASTDNLAQISNIVKQLSALVPAAEHFSQDMANLPLAINRMAARSINQHAATAINHIIQTQHRAVVSIVSEQGKKTDIDYDLLASRISEKLLENGARKTSSSLRLANGIKQLFKK